jgi:hypothetical protein
MDADAQRFLNHDATGGTALRRATWVNLNTHRTGSFRLVLCVADQLIPRCISNALCQTVVLDHPVDTQVLKNNNAELGHKAATQFMREVLAPIRNAFVDTPHNPLVILAFRRAFGFFCHTTLRPCKRLFVAAKEARIGDLFARGERGEVRQAHIDTDSRTTMLNGVWLPKIARHNEIPVISATREGQGFDRAFDGAVQHDSDVADVVEVHSIAGHLRAVANHKINGIEAISALEAWVACRFSTLDTAEKRLKGFVQAAQGLLATGEVGLSKVEVGDAINLQLCRLIAVAHAALVLFPCVFAFGKRTIVQMPMCIKHLNHRPRLLARWVQAVAERYTHNLAPCLLLLNVAADRRGCNRTCTATKIASAPQRR